MDIEGAEYKLLQRCMNTGVIGRITLIKVEWHWDRYSEIGKIEHDRICERLRSMTRLEDWQ